MVRIADQNRRTSFGNLLARGRKPLLIIPAKVTLVVANKPVIIVGHSIGRVTVHEITGARFSQHVFKVSTNQ
jgi:hypothetical protein